MMSSARFPPTNTTTKVAIRPPTGPMNPRRVFDRWAPTPNNTGAAQVSLDSELQALNQSIQALHAPREELIKVANEIDTVDFDDDGTEAQYDYSAAGTPNPALERKFGGPTSFLLDPNEIYFFGEDDEAMVDTPAPTGFNQVALTKAAVEQVQTELAKKHGGVMARAYYQPPPMTVLTIFNDPRDAKIASLEYELAYYKNAAAYERADADAQASKAENIWTEKNIVWKDASDGWKMVGILRRKNRFLEQELKMARGRNIEYNNNGNNGNQKQIEAVDSRKMIQDRMDRIGDGTPVHRRRSASPVMQKEGELFGARAMTVEHEWDAFLL